jgi:hypothetical protein
MLHIVIPWQLMISESELVYASGKECMSTARSVLFIRCHALCICKGHHDSCVFVARIEKGGGPLLCGGCLVGASEAVISKGKEWYT